MSDDDPRDDRTSVPVQAEVDGEKLRQLGFDMGLPDVAVSSSLTRLRSTVVSSLESLPVRFTPER